MKPLLPLLILGLLMGGCAPRLGRALNPEVAVPQAPAPETPADARAAWLQAAAAEARGEHERAEEAWRRLVRLDPHRPWSHLGLARFLVGQGRDAEALRAARDALERPPEQGEAHRLAGEVLLRSGEHAEAAGHLERALWLAPEPRVLEAAVQAARLSCGLGRVWDWAVKTGLEERRELAWRRAALQLGRAVRDPVLVDRAASALDPGDDALLRDRVDLLLGARQAERALEVLAEARAARDPAEQGVTFWEEGRVLHSLGRHEPALQALSRVPLEGPWGARAAALQVEVLLSLDREDAALALAESAARARPEPQVRFAWALALQAAGRVQEAEDALADPAAAWQLGRLRQRRGDVRGALAAWESGGDARSAHSRASLLVQQGELDAAVAIWRGLAAVDPADAQARLGLARHRPEERERWLGEIEQVDPCRPEIWTHRLAEDLPPEAARTLLERSLVASPGSAWAWESLATILHATGEGNRAREAMERAVRLQPTPARLEALEGAWRAEGEDAAADRAAAERRALEGP